MAVRYKKKSKRRINAVEYATFKPDEKKAEEALSAFKSGEYSVDWDRFSDKFGETPLEYLSYIQSEKKRMAAIAALETSIWEPRITSYKDPETKEYTSVVVVEKSKKWKAFEEKYEGRNPADWLREFYSKDYNTFLSSEDSDQNYKGIEEEDVFKLGLALKVERERVIEEEKGARYTMIGELEKLYNKIYKDDEGPEEYLARMVYEVGINEVKKYDKEILRGYSSWAPDDPKERRSINVERIRSYDQLKEQLKRDSSGKYNYPNEIRWYYNEFTQTLLLNINDTTYLIAEPLTEYGYLDRYLSLWNNGNFDEMLESLINDQHYYLFGDNYGGDTKIDVYLVENDIFNKRRKEKIVSVKTQGRRAVESNIESQYYDFSRGKSVEEYGPYQRRKARIEQYARTGKLEEDIEKISQEAEFGKGIPYAQKKGKVLRRQITPEEAERIVPFELGKTTKILADEQIESLYENLKHITLIEIIKNIHKDRLIPTSDYDSLYWILAEISFEINTRITDIDNKIDILDKRFIQEGFKRRLKNKQKIKTHSSLIHSMSTANEGVKKFTSSHIISYLPMFWQKIAWLIILIVDSRNPDSKSVSLSDIMSYLINISLNQHEAINKWIEGAINVVLEKTVEVNADRFREVLEKRRRQMESATRRDVTASEAAKDLKIWLKSYVKEKFFEQWKIISQNYLADAKNQTNKIIKAYEE